jgi:antirestriction protein
MKTSGKSWAKYIDKSIKAKKVGYRKSSVTGERYYEARPDHSDSNPKERYADGGMMAKGGSIKVNLGSGEMDLEDAIKMYEDKIKAQGRVTNERDENILQQLKKMRPKMAKGGKTKKAKEPMIVRGYFEDEAIDYGKGGKMARGGNTDDTPKIYVADLEAYNNGKLKGQWVDLSDYDNGEEVMQKIGEIVGDNEYAIHDYENFSRDLYSESMGEDDFNKVIQVYKVSEDKGIPADVLGTIMREYEPDDLEEWIDEHYEGEFSSDQELAENYVESIGGVAELGQDTLERYFDYESFGRDLAYDYHEYDGHYFRSYARGGTMGKTYDLKKYVFNTGFNYSIGGL